MTIYQKKINQLRAEAVKTLTSEPAGDDAKTATPALHPAQTPTNSSLRASRTVQVLLQRVR